MRPPAGVLAAFGSSAEPERLPGGMETSWRCGDLVLKPLDLSIEEVRWQGALFERLESDGFRVPRLRGVSEGWCAWEYLDGEHRVRAWPEVIAVGARFHAAIVDVPRSPGVSSGPRSSLTSSTCRGLSRHCGRSLPGANSCTAT